jgi:hypothetical protein
MDSLVSLAKAKGLAVVFDLRQAFSAQVSSKPRNVCNTSGTPAWLYPGGSGSAQAAKCAFLEGTTPAGAPEDIWTGFAAMWHMVAARYADDPTVVGLDMVNEPYPPRGSCSPSQIRVQDLYAIVGRAIRSISPNVLLIFEDAGPGDALSGQFELTSPPPFPNVVYSYHLYQPNWSIGGQLDQAYWRRAQAWGVPVLVGEFNAFGYAAPGSPRQDPNWQADTLAAIGSWRARGVSWNIWAYSGGNHLVDTGGTPRADLISSLQQGFPSPS